jgi:hypothetical protein
MIQIRKRAAATFAAAAIVTAVAPVGAATADPGLDCVKKSVGAYVDKIVNGGPQPMPCG